jgi:hypothetical protein
LIVSIEQHLVRLQEIGPHDEGSAVAQLGVGHLQLGAFIADDGPVFRPVELEGFPRFERQGHEGAAPGRVHLPLPIGLPFPGKGRHSIVGTAIAQAHQVGMQLPDGPPLLAGLVRLPLQPRRQSVRKRI